MVENLSVRKESTGAAEAGAALPGAAACGAIALLSLMYNMSPCLMFRAFRVTWAAFSMY